MERIFDDNDKFDYVYHLAAEYGRWNGEGYYENLWETNVIGLKNMIRLQEKLGFRMISFSSAEVYGDYEGIMTEDVMENRPIKDTYQMNDYAISKWAGELMCMNSATMFGTETVRVRPVNCYGPHEAYSPYKGFIPIFIYKALHGLPYSVHKGHKRIIDYVEDTANTFAVLCAEHLHGKPYHNLFADKSINIELISVYVIYRLFVIPDPDRTVILPGKHIVRIDIKRYRYRL
jgi:dTDP-glucose 4,6-dehydratase